LPLLPLRQRDMSAGGYRLRSDPASPRAQRLGRSSRWSGPIRQRSDRGGEHHRVGGAERHEREYPPVEHREARFSPGRRIAEPYVRAERRDPPAVVDLPSAQLYKSHGGGEGRHIPAASTTARAHHSSPSSARTRSRNAWPAMVRAGACHIAWSYAWRRRSSWSSKAASRSCCVQPASGTAGA
jgi:hypothetical protein